MKKIFSLKGGNHQKAFTLIELLIVIAILGILAAAIIVAINPVKKINQAKDSNLKSDMGQIVNAVQIYFTSTGTEGNPRYPNLLKDLVDAKELKTMPKQQAGAKNCKSMNPDASQGGGAEYCYGVSTGSSNDKAVVWGYLLDAKAAYFCWDSTNGVLKASAESAAEPTSVGGYVCN